MRIIFGALRGPFFVEIFLVLTYHFYIIGYRYPVHRITIPYKEPGSLDFTRVFRLFMIR